jgi:hypothetical protein
MKRNLVALSALVVAIAFSAFTTSKLTLPRYYKFVGATTSASDLTNPQKWEEIGTPLTDDHFASFVSQLFINANESTYIYMSGSNVDKPKVDDSGLDLQADIMLAGGHSSPANVQEVDRADYDITVNSTQRN